MAFKANLFAFKAYVIHAHSSSAIDLLYDGIAMNLMDTDFFMFGITLLGLCQELPQVKRIECPLCSLLSCPFYGKGPEECQGAEMTTEGR